MDAFTPQQTVELCSRIGTKKAFMRLDKLFWNSFMSGPLLGFGCAVLVSTNASPWYQDNAPGLIRTLGALLFPIGLVMIVLSGADLWTSNVMFMTTAFLHRRVSVWDVTKNWFISFFGNLAGALFFTCIIMGYGGVFEETPAYTQAAIRIAVEKAQNPAWYQIFLRAIGANWLVSFAVFISISSREVVSKITAIWWPTATFVALALDHVVANMIFIPLGIWVGAPFGVGYYIWKSMIPTALGNFVGGGLFVGAVYWYLYLTGEGNVTVDFNIGSLNTAMEAGGPMREPKPKIAKIRHNGGASAAVGGEEDREKASESENTSRDFIDGVDPSALPHSGGQLVSAVGHELADGSVYAQSHAERTKTARNSEEQV